MNRTVPKNNSKRFRQWPVARGTALYAPAAELALPCLSDLLYALWHLPLPPRLPGGRTLLLSRRERGMGSRNTSEQPAIAT